MKKRKRYSLAQIAKKLHDAEAMWAARKTFGELLQALEVRQATLNRKRAQPGSNSQNPASSRVSKQDLVLRFAKVFGSIAACKQARAGERKTIFLLFTRHVSLPSHLHWG